jgi:hypothetical protein
MVDVLDAPDDWRYDTSADHLNSYDIEIRKAIVDRWTVCTPEYDYADDYPGNVLIRQINL